VRVFVVGLVAASSACAGGGGHPVFRARTDSAWVSYEVEGDRIAADILPLFRDRAKDWGCSIDRMCREGFDAPRSWSSGKRCYGVTAHCHGEIISVIGHPESRFTVGCLRPMTIEQCDALLTKIMQH